MRCLTVPVVLGAGLRGELSLALSLAVMSFLPLESTDSRGRKALQMHPGEPRS